MSIQDIKKINNRLNVKAILKKKIKSNKVAYSFAYTVLYRFSSILMTVLVFLEVISNEIKIFLN